MRGFTAERASGSDSLLEQIASVANLATALLHVARNKGAAGVDDKSVDDVVADSHRLLPKLRAQLLSGDYHPGDIKRVWIPKPGGGQRGLGIPTVVDRWVQQAVNHVLSPLFEPRFHASSHGFRPGRGAHTAIAEAKTHLQDDRTWLVSIDVSKFFDRVHHQRLLARMRQRVEDVRVLSLVHRMLKAKVVEPTGKVVKPREGTPQGGPLSPLLSNIVLDELDWELERRGLRFVRYADDFNVFVSSERSGLRVMASLSRFIEKRLRLKVNTDKSVVARSPEVHFLGFSLQRRSDGTVAVRLSSRTRERLYRKIRALTPRLLGRSVDACIAESNAYLRGWLGYFRLCTHEVRQDLRSADAHLRRRLRAIMVRQKKRPRYLYRHLCTRGVSRWLASRTAWWSGGVWKKSNLPGMTRAYRNAWFHERLVSLWSGWSQANPKTTASGQVLLPGLK